MAENDPSAPRVFRDAILFLPSLGGSDSAWGADQSVDAIAKRIANALDFNAVSAKATFTRAVREKAYGDESSPFKSRVCTISRADATGGQIPLIDVYGVNYGSTLTRDFERRSLPLKCLFVFLQVTYGFGMLITVMFRRHQRGTSLAQKLQLVWITFIVLLLCAYLSLLIAAAAGIVVTTLSGSAGQPPLPPVSQTAPSTVPASISGTTAPSTQSPHRGFPRSLVDWYKQRQSTVHNILILLTALGIVLPKNLKQTVSEAGLQYLSAIYYIRVGFRLPALIAQTVSLLDSITSDPEVTYDRIHLMGYSFGSILAIDAVFRRRGIPEIRFGVVHTLITIGCPFDLIRTLWPNHFNGRHATPSTPPAPLQWLNIYSPLDIFGSNFRNDSEKGESDQGIGIADSAPAPAGAAAAPLTDDRCIQRMPTSNRPYSEGGEDEHPSWSDYVTLIGLKAHSSYWGRGDELTTDCFKLVVEDLYKGTFAMS